MAALSSGSVDPAPDVVVLCNDEAARDALAYWLTGAGLRARVARNGREARYLLRPLTRLLITDRVLPPWPGLDTIISLKHELADLKVAFIDDGVPDTRMLMMSAGADIILARPLRRALVLDAYASTNRSARGLACAS